MATIGFVVPTKENERRRAITPVNLQGFPKADKLLFETGYGLPLGIKDDDYRSIGARIGSRKEVCECPVICNPKPMVNDPCFGSGKTLFGWIHAVQGRLITDALLSCGMTAIAWEDMYEGGRHTFWRNNELSGEAALFHVAMLWGRPLYEAKAAVIGRGNVARGAVRVLDRMGCHVTVYGRQTVSLLRKEIDQYDVVVNAVLWDVFRTDHIIYEEDLDRMKAGSIIVDISCDEAMGVQTSRPTTIEDPIYYHKGVMHYVVDHVPTLLFRAATESISREVVRFLPELIDGRSGPTIQKATIIDQGRIVDDRIRRFQGRA